MVRVGLYSHTLVALATFACVTGYAQGRVSPLTDLSLEQLGNIEVTSVSRRAERLADAPASIYVITGEDIRRAGVTRLPEALRLAPNLQVARVALDSAEKSKLKLSSRLLAVALQVRTGTP